MIDDEHKGSNNIGNNFVIQYPIFIKSRRGGLLLSIGGYTFSRHCQLSNKFRWACTLAKRQGCRAAAYTCTKEGQVIECNNEHNHPVKGEEQADARYAESASFKLTKRGNLLMNLEGFSYSQHKSYGNKTRWECTQRSKARCKAAVVTLTETQKILRLYGEHNHS
ncbi:unnamed protein product [Chilo suppressalis]|uniref:FLYWCH-type domain-containing protein n=1 Tax=Chilo suppressalis TaxID=168631 RepID=A0ABN8AYF9_CHISP|nr:unnamed protein product [Chilo suppressalis]